MKKKIRLLNENVISCDVVIKYIDFLSNDAKSWPAIVLLDQNNKLEIKSKKLINTKGFDRGFFYLSFESEDGSVKFEERLNIQIDGDSNVDLFELKPKQKETIEFKNYFKREKLKIILNDSGKKDVIKNKMKI